jgi:uncharacterized cupredoxin-like copper-binding protein
MSFARRALVTVLAIQALVIVRELVFVVGLGRVADGLGRLSPEAVLPTIILIANIALLVPVWRGNKWATLATVPLSALLLLVALPIWLFVFPQPSEDNFAVWFSLTVAVLASAVGIPISIMATLEAFGRRRSSPAPAAPGFSLSSMFVVAVVAALIGMAVLAVAVAASPASQGDMAFDQPPGGYASLTMRDVRFAPDALQIRGGTPTAVFVTNEDGFDHSFDIDSADVHVMVGPHETKVVMLTAAAGDALDFYCAIPGHRDAGMVGHVIAD